MGSAIVRTGIDATVMQDHPTVNYGAAKTLSVRNNPLDNYAFLWFRNPAPRNATVLSARLFLYGRATAPSATLTAYRVAASWYQSWIKWANAPGVAGNPVTVTKANADKAEWAFDVTSQIQTMTSGGAANYGFRINTSAGDSTRRDFYAIEQGGLYAPRLEVTWSDAPKKPTTLSPSGGRAVGIAKPVLRFDYTDVSGSVQLSAVQVQVTRTSGAAAFTGSDTALWDSGAVASAVPELDLSATGYGGLWWDVPSWWRVRVQDAAGLWSSWSDPSQVVYEPHGSVTIDNPAPAVGAAPAFVSEPTPPITWTFGGNFRSQTAWRVAVALDSNPTKVLHDTGRRKGTDNSYTLPKGVLTREDAAYRVTVQIWDDKDRESTPGDYSTVWLTRTFQFAEDPTPDPPTGLAVDFNIDGKPWVTLTWARATAPDSFTILRDGANVAVGLDPADCNTDPTHYRYVDKDAAPNAFHTWGVRAVVNGVSTAGTWWTGTMKSGALWLVDTGSDRLVPILDAALASFDMPELATVYEPVGAEVVVRVVQAQRGAQGSVTGRLSTYAKMDAAAAQDNMLWFKERPTNDLRLSVGNASYRVLIGNVVVAPLNEATGDRSVSFDFWSLDGAP